mmetsp:Transcript_15150/g.23016  ORF Transcript_15150/g.23016 Transcript_15150/m.23016 type:complete len:232 (-) Transcript_15150:78-773(-)
MCGEHAEQNCGMCGFLAGRPSKAEILCKHWARSGFSFCNRGIHCQFWHPESEKDIGPCKYDQRGVCAFKGKCLVGHHFPGPKPGCQKRNCWAYRGKEDATDKDLGDDEDLPELWDSTQDDDGDSEVLETPSEVSDSTRDGDGDSEVPETPGNYARRNEILTKEQLDDIVQEQIDDDFEQARRNQILKEEQVERILDNFQSGLADIASSIHAEVGRVLPAQLLKDDAQLDGD